MRIGLIGINHKLACLEEREAIARWCKLKFDPKFSFHEPFPYVLLNTCNRTEIYFSDESSSKELPEIHTYILSILKKGMKEPLDQKLYSYFGPDCFLHLAEVTTGFDSADRGETAIQGQVKEAYQLACASQHLSSSLHYLFQKSLKIGKEIRHSFLIGKGLPTFEQTIYHTGTKKFGQTQDTPILIVGASKINEKITSFLQKKGCRRITLCNRNPKNGEKFSAKFNLTTLLWKHLPEWRRFDWIILGTKASEYLIDLHSAPCQGDSQKLVLDLGVPRNADPRLAKHPMVDLHDIDLLNQALSQEQSLEQIHFHDARLAIEASISKYVHLYSKKQRHTLSCYKNFS
jgi:glutamyl-tRNA reductase